MNSKAQQSVAGYPPQGVGSPEPWRSASRIHRISHGKIMQDYGKKSALFRHNYTKPDAIRSREAKYPRYTAKIGQTGWLWASDYRNLCHFSKNTEIGGLTAKNIRFMAYFSTFPTYRHQKRYARTIRLIKKCHVFVKKCHVIPLARPYEHLAYFRQKDRNL